MSEFNRIIGPVHIEVTDAHMVAVTAIVGAPPLTPGQASEVAAGLTEAAEQAVRNAKAEADAKARLETVKEKSNVDMF